PEAVDPCRLLGRHRRGHRGGGAAGPRDGADGALADPAAQRAARVPAVGPPPARARAGVTMRPVVLVHGFGSSFEHGWREPGWADILADGGREVIGVDLLGHGESSKPLDPAAYRDGLRASVADVLPAGPVD